MAASELSPRTSGPTPASGRDDGTRELRDEVVALAHALPGELHRLTVRSGDRAVEVEWAAAAPAGGDPRPAAAGRPEPAPTGSTDPTAEVPEGTSAVRAPLVGTFYAAPSPGADPFVRVGDEVEPGRTLGIVEAMKLMNPILAEEPGVVAEILVSDAQSVEYDQVLMHLRPAGRVQ